MCYSVLKGDDNDKEAFLGIATSEFSFVIMRMTKNSEVLALIEGIHANDITSVLALTDNRSTLSFVTMSLDT